MLVRVLISSALLIIVLAGCGTSSATPPSTATPAPSPTLAAGRTPTAVPTVPAVSSPSPSASPTSPATAASPADPVAADIAVVRAHGYTPAKRYVSVPDGFGNTLYAWHGTCAGSADGYCQIMLFFLGTRYLGTDTAQASTAISNYQAAGTGSIAITYEHYAPNDALCCASLPPVTVVYHWNGTRLIPSGTPPGH